MKSPRGAASHASSFGERRITLWSAKPLPYLTVPQRSSTTTPAALAASEAKAEPIELVAPDCSAAQALLLSRWPIITGLPAAPAEASAPEAEAPRPIHCRRCNDTGQLPEGGSYCRQPSGERPPIR